MSTRWTEGEGARPQDFARAPLTEHQASWDGNHKKRLQCSVQAECQVPTTALTAPNGGAAKYQALLLLRMSGRHVTG